MKVFIVLAGIASAVLSAPTYGGGGGGGYPSGGGGFG